MNIVSDVVFLPQLYRVLHDRELGALWRQAPEVFWGNRDSTPFGESWQLRSFEMNPGMAPAQWRVLYESNTAFTNGTGFDNPNGQVRADYVNRRDLGAAVPRWNSQIFCGGTLLAGREDRGDLVIELMNGLLPPPPLKWILMRPWLYFDALTVDLDGHLNRFPQNGGARVRVPLVGSSESRYPLSKLEKLPRDLAVLPDPYRVYHPA